MNEPRRLLDDDGPGAALLNAARAYRPPPSARRKVQRMLGLPVVLSLGATLSAALASTSAKVLLVATLAATAGGVATYRGDARNPAVPEPRRLDVQSVPAPAPVAPPTPTEARAEEASGSSPARSAQVRRSKPPARRHAPARGSQPPIVAPSAPPATAVLPHVERDVAVVPPAPLPPPPGLAAELALLDAADGAIRQRRFPEALARLQEHRRAFPDSELAEEATVLRISALVGTDQRAAARAEAQRFLSHAGDSPLADRVRSILTAVNNPP
jgi:hypothetical protein